MPKIVLRTMTKKEKTVLERKFHNVCVRFFGAEYVEDEDIMNFMMKIKKIFGDELSKIDTRVSKLERKVFSKGRHFREDGIEVRRNYRHICNEKCEVSKEINHE